MRLLALQLSALIAATALPAWAADGANVVTQVEVKAQGGATTVVIHGSRPPNFTTFSMVDPPRFVIDLAESTLRGVPEDAAVDDGTVHLVKALNYGTGESAIARIMIAFQRDVDPPDLQASGNDLVVKVGKPVAAPADVAAAPAAPAAAPAVAAEVAPAGAAASGGAALAVAAAGATAAATPATPAAASAAPAAEPAAAAAAGGAALAAGAGDDSDRARREELARQERENNEVRAWKEARRLEEARRAGDDKAQVTQLSAAAQAQEEAKKQADAEHSERAAAEARVHVAEAKVARLAALGEPVPEEDAKALADARLALAELEGRLAPPAVAVVAAAPVEPPAPLPQAQAAAPAAAAPEPIPVPAPAPAAAPVAPEAVAVPEAVAAGGAAGTAAGIAAVAAKPDDEQAKPEAKPALSKKERQALAKREAAEKRKAEQEAKLAAKREAAEKRKAEQQAKLVAKREAAEQRKAELDARRAAKAALAGEKPREVREVGFRQLASASRVFVRLSGEPRFHIVEAGDKLIRVELPNTRVVRRNDARFLDTSFFPGAVAMVTPRPHGSTTVLEIALKEKVAYQQKVEGDTLALDFEQPAPKTAAAP